MKFLAVFVVVVGLLTPSLLCTDAPGYEVPIQPERHTDQANMGVGFQNVGRFLNPLQMIQPQQYIPEIPTQYGEQPMVHPQEGIDMMSPPQGYGNQIQRMEVQNKQQQQEGGIIMNPIETQGPTQMVIPEQHTMNRPALMPNFPRFFRGQQQPQSYGRFQNQMRNPYSFNPALMSTNRYVSAQPSGQMEEMTGRMMAIQPMMPKYSNFVRQEQPLGYME